MFVNSAIFANSADPDQTVTKEQSAEGMHYLPTVLKIYHPLVQKIWIWKKQK